MKPHLKFRIAGLAGILAVGLTGLVHAQDEGQDPRSRTGAAQDPAAGAIQDPTQDVTRPTAGQAGGLAGGQIGGQGQASAAGNQMLIGHALGMAIDGSMLHLAAQKKSEEGVQPAAGQEQNPVDDLRQHAREAYDGSNRLFREAFNILRNEGGAGGGAGAGGAGADAGGAGAGSDAGGAGAGGAGAGAGGAATGVDAASGPGAGGPITGTPGGISGPGGAGAGAGGNAQSQQFYQVANQYTQTLWALTGQATGQDAQSGAAGGQANGQPAPGGAGRPGTTGGATTLSETDLAKLTVINHSVKEAVEAAQLQQAIRFMGQGGAAARELQSHAMEMANHSQQSLQKLAGAGAAGGSPAGAADPAAGAADPAAGAADPAAGAADPTRLDPASATDPTRAKERASGVQQPSPADPASDDPEFKAVRRDPDNTLRAGTDAAPIDPNADDQPQAGAGAQPGGAAGGQQGQPSVETLAQQGLQIAQTLQQLSAGAGAGQGAGGQPAPGTGRTTPGGGSDVLDIDVDVDTPGAGTTPRTGDQGAQP